MAVHAPFVWTGAADPSGDQQTHPQGVGQPPSPAEGPEKVQGKRPETSRVQGGGSVPWKERADMFLVRKRGPAGSLGDRDPGVWSVMRAGVANPGVHL